MSDPKDILVYFGYKATGAPISCELHDTQEEVNPDDARKRLAEQLDTNPDDPDFDWNITTCQLPEATINRIRNDEVTYLMSRYSGDPDMSHEMFKLLWMIEHGKTLKDLVRELQNMQYDDPEDSDRISTPITELFDEWEYDRGFGGSIWPCMGEFLDCEGKDLQP